MNVSQKESRRTRRSTGITGGTFVAGLFAPAVALAIGACSGSGADEGPTFVDPDTVTFEYGAASDASGTWAAETISRRVADALAEVAEPGEARVEYVRAFDLAFLPIDLSAGTMPEDVNIRVFGDVTRQFLESQIRWETCVTATSGQVEYRGCRGTAGYQVEDYQLDGTLTRSGTALEWNLLLQAQGNRFHLIGNLEASADSVTGHVRADQVMYEVPFTDAVDVALTLDGDGCPTAGTVEVKRLYSRHGREGEAPPSFIWSDHGVRFLWTGCGEVAAAIR